MQCPTERVHGMFFSLQFDVKALVEALGCPAVNHSLMNLKSIRGPMSDEGNLLHTSCLVYIPSCPSSSLILSCRELSQLSAEDLKTFQNPINTNI